MTVVSMDMSGIGISKEIVGGSMGDTVKDKTKKKNWFKDLKAEFKNISWPDRKTLTKETAAVLIVSVLLGLMIAALDFIIRFGLEFLI